MESPVLGGVMQDVAVVGCRVVFFLSAVLLMVLVLLQEGKGGGLASALGGQGAETFGVATGGVNRLTLWLAGIFLVSALGHTMAYKSTLESLRTEDRPGQKPAPGAPVDDLLAPGGDGEGTKEPPKEAPPPPPRDAPPPPPEAPK